jgi:GxxExxY protein
MEWAQVSRPEGARMGTNERRAQLNRITEQIIGCAYRVSNGLGWGFAEKVHENALAIELRKAGLEVAQQAPLVVHYDGQVVGEYTADLLVEECVLVELKAVEALAPAHTAQCLNYLKATGLQVCLLLNFGQPRLQVERVVNCF